MLETFFILLIPLYSFLVIVYVINIWRLHFMSGMFLHKLKFEVEDLSGGW